MSVGLLILFIVVGILAVAGVAAALISKKQNEKARRFALITQDRRGFVMGGDDQEKMAKQRAENIARKLKQASADNAEKKKDRLTIRELMMQAGIEAPVSSYWIGSLIFCLVTWALVSLMTGWPQIAVFLIAFTAFFGVPKFFLKWKAARRQKKFMEEFADALDASVRLLQAGMPISEAVAMVSREFTGPLREEMTRMYENQKIGMSLGGAALEMARRIPLTEVHMFATALQIQSETGSSLSEVLSNLSAVIRARFRLKRKVKALSSEAKASAAIIAALPILVSLGLYLVNKPYISILFDTVKGNFFLGGAITWMIIGVIIMKQMINFKV